MIKQTARAAISRSLIALGLRLRHMGVEAMSADCEALVQDGLVKRFIPRFTAETLARLKAASERA